MTNLNYFRTEMTEFLKPIPSTSIKTTELTRAPSNQRNSRTQNAPNWSLNHTIIFIAFIIFAFLFLAWRITFPEIAVSS